MAKPLLCPLCGHHPVLEVPCRSAGERLLRLVGMAPFRCQFCTHKFPAFRWGRQYPKDVLDRREHRRIPVRMALSFSGNRVKGEGTLVDISMGGCLVQSPMSVGLDQIFYLRISEQEPPLELAATVRSTGPRGIGFQFLRASREDKRLLEFLQAHDRGGSPAPKTRGDDRS